MFSIFHINSKLALCKSKTRVEKKKNLNFEDLKVTDFKKKNVLSKNVSSPIHNAFNYAEQDDRPLKYMKPLTDKMNNESNFYSNQKVKNSQYYDCKENIRTSDVM